MLVDRIALAERLSFFCRKAIHRSGGKLGHVDAVAGRQVLQGALEHLGAANHVLEGGHGVLTRRFLVGDRRVEVVGAGLRDQQRRFRLIAARSGGVIQPAQSAEAAITTVTRFLR